MNHSDTDDTLSLSTITSIAPNDVNLTHLATPRCPILQELDPRGATVPITIPSRTQQTAVGLLSFDDSRTENSQNHSPPHLCLPMTTPDCHRQPLSRRTLRYIRRNARRAADDESPFTAAGRSKTIVYTVGTSTYSTLGFPAQIQVPKLEDVYENNRCPPDPVPNLNTPRKSPAPPSSPRANHRWAKKNMTFPTKNTMATSAARPTSPPATAGTDSATVSPSAPLLLRTAAHPGLDRSRNQRPSSPVSSTLAAPPAHMRAFAPFWDTIPAATKRPMFEVTFHDVERSVETAKAEAAATAIQLADDEHREQHDLFVANQNHLISALHDTRGELASLESKIRECKIRADAFDRQKRSAEDAVHASSRAHTAYKTGLRTTPSSRPQRAAATAKMAPPPPRASAHAVHHTRPAQVLPAERSDPPATWAAVTSRRSLHDAHIATDDSYLDVRVSSLRHHNWDFTTAPRDAISVLSTMTHKALEDVGRSKASLKFALDLALKAPSPLSADIVGDTIELCDLGRTMHSARYSPTWFSENIKKTRESRPRSRRVEFDSAARSASPAPP